jgi:hypothetical protein
VVAKQTSWNKPAPMRVGVWGALAMALVLSAPASSQREDFGSRLGLQRGGEVTFEPTGPGILFNALDPAVRKWYVPQELQQLYKWQQWEYTNYARNRYQRYVGTDIEGDYFYDLYGTYINRGWLIYDWRQQQPEQFGSTIFKDPRFNSWFNQVVISSDQKGQNHLSMTIGSRIRTTLTPLTFSKPAYDGIQIDYQSDKYSMTALLTRASSPGVARTVAVQSTNATNLFGYHGEVQLGDFVRVGGTYINAHNSQTQLESFEGDPLSGSLTVGQNLEHVGVVFVRLSDDSPEDRAGGASLFSWDIIIEAENEVLRQDESGDSISERETTKVRGSEIGFEPAIEGGFQRLGFLAADGDEQIELSYDFRDLSYNGPELSTIRRVEIELVVANDYHIEMGSDRQTNLPERQPVLLTKERASGNVQDGSNLRLLRFDYGLPTANDIIGFNIEVQNVAGFNFYGEWDRSRLFRKYPNRAFDRHRTSSDDADAWMMNISRQSFPWFFFGEAFKIDGDYRTTSFVTSPAGDIDYTDSAISFYEWVEDNDDQDRTPDWQRVNQAGPDQQIFPGWDENNDFISDFNQNDNEFRPNFIPDYDEPFLRYDSDRPEFLFGVDMNNNGWIDRFENDEEPDYPYHRDRRGFNAYVGSQIGQHGRLTVGHQRAEAPSSSRENRGSYGMFTWDASLAGVGRLRVYDMVKLVEDDIADNLVQWVQPVGSAGTLQRIADPLAAPDTWINSAYIGFDYTGIEGLRLVNKVKYELWRQRQDVADFRKTFQFFGLVNKAEYHQQVSRVQIIPKVKNELRLERPLLSNEPIRKENSLFVFLIGKTKILRHTELQAGVEYTIFNQLENPVPIGLRQDFTETVVALQLSNSGAYLGYNMTSQIGLRMNRIDRKGEPAFTGVSQFVTVYAALD